MTGFFGGVPARTDTRKKVTSRYEFGAAARWDVLDGQSKTRTGNKLRKRFPSPGQPRKSVSNPARTDPNHIGQTSMEEDLITGMDEALDEQDVDCVCPRLSLTH